VLLEQGTELVVAPVLGDVLDVAVGPLAAAMERGKDRWVERDDTTAPRS
jgi:hypothetical protein